MSIKVGDGFEWLWNLDFEERYECLLKFGTKDLLEGSDNYTPYIFVVFFGGGVEMRYQICKLYSFNSRALDTLLFPHLNIFDICFRVDMQEVIDLLLKLKKIKHLPCSRYYTGC